MSESTPSQAEGDRDASDDEANGPSRSGAPEHAEPPRTTPSQAEGDDDAEGSTDS
jgi:hypothetical protein